MSYKEELLKNDRIRVQGGKDVDIRFHDGGLRHAVGVKNYQIMRACRNAEWSGDGYGWTYNHAAMIAWWNKKFFVEYLSNVKTEHMPPGQTLMCHSEDGRHWSKPEMVFPSIEVPTAPYHRTGQGTAGRDDACDLSSADGILCDQERKAFSQRFLWNLPQYPYRTE